MVKQKFMQGTLILSIAGLITKVLGALYRIPLARMLGGEGMGLYQMAYPVYTSILAISTAGIPVAISILVSEKLAISDYKGAKRVFYVSLFLLFITGLIFSFIVFKSSSFLANKILGEPRAFFPIITISPAIFFIALVSAFRGFFQGHQNMIPTAISQVVEQSVRVITILIGAYLLLPYGVEYAASGATLGAVTGGVSALIILIILYFHFTSNFHNDKNIVQFKQESIIKTIGKIIIVGLPLSVGGLLMPIMQAIDAFIVPLRLQAAGLSPSRATELFGQLTGMAATLINLPTIVTISLAVSLVPAVSEAIAKKNYLLTRNRVVNSLRMTILTCLPASAGLAVLAAPISILLYDIQEVSIPLTFLAPGVLFLGLYQTTSGALQGLNKTYIPVINLFIGVIIKTFLNYYLTGLSKVTIIGSAIATVSGFAIAFSLNYLVLRKYLKIKINWISVFLIPTIATSLMIIVTKKVYLHIIMSLNNSFATLSAISCGFIVYSICILIFGGISAQELSILPGGEKIASFLKKIHILR